MDTEETLAVPALEIARDQTKALLLLMDLTETERQSIRAACDEMREKVDAVRKELRPSKLVTMLTLGEILFDLNRHLQAQMAAVQGVGVQGEA